MLAAPREVKFHSVDYKNILYWTPPTNSTSLQYYVQWKMWDNTHTHTLLHIYSCGCRFLVVCNLDFYYQSIIDLLVSYGEPEWLDVVGCQGIRKLQCDLSDVTSTPREWYYARVHASSPPASKSGWTLSSRFSPRSDSECFHTSSTCILFVGSLPHMMQLWLIKLLTLRGENKWNSKPDPHICSHNQPPCPEAECNGARDRGPCEAPQTAHPQDAQISAVQDLPHTSQWRGGTTHTHTISYLYC